MHSYSQLKEAMSSISMKRGQGMTSHILYMEKGIDKPTFEKAAKVISQELSKSFKGLTDPKQFVHGVSAWNNGKPYYQVTVDTTKSEYSQKTDTKVITILGDAGDSALDGKFMISTRKNMLPEAEESIEESLLGIASYAQEQRESLIKTLKPGDKVSTRKMKMEGTFVKIATEGGLEKVYFKVADGRVMKTPIENILRGSLKEDEEYIFESTDPVEMFKELGYKISKGSSDEQQTTLKKGGDVIVVTKTRILYRGDGMDGQGKKAMDIAKKSGLKYAKY